MKSVHPYRLGLVLGCFFAVWHLLWSSLVGVGVAQSVIDFIFRLHMINPPYQVGEFHLGIAAGLVLVTGGIGFIAGWLIGLFWNRLLPNTLEVNSGFAIRLESK